MIKKFTIKQKNYLIDSDYFEKIDNEDKAYILGFLLSDGNVYKNRIKLKLKKEDGYMVKEIFDKFSTGHTTMYSQNNCSIMISSNKMVNDLKKYGCVANKTHNKFDLPNIQENMYRHFIRGYFDGDGSISNRKLRPNQVQINICSINENFLKQLQKKLSEFNIKTKIYVEIRENKLLKMPSGDYSKNNLNMFRLSFTTHESRINFYKYIYDNSNIKLKRKYNFFTKYYEKIIDELEKKKQDEKTIVNLFNKGLVEFQIHKQTKIGRRIIKQTLIETNLI